MHTYRYLCINKKSFPPHSLPLIDHSIKYKQFAKYAVLVHWTTRTD